LIGNQIHGLDLLIYGALLVFFIIRMPKGILGTWLERKSGTWDVSNQSR